MADTPSPEFIDVQNLGPAEPRALRPGEVHLWLADLRLPSAWLEECGSVLSSDEIERRDRFHFARHRRRFQARRGLLRMLLGRYADRPPSALEFGYEEQGKPFLLTADGRPDRQLAFNISDSADGLLLGFLRWPAEQATTPTMSLGLDLEVLRPMRNADGMGRRVFSELDRQTWESLPQTQKDQAFLLLWTRKEAILKATGEGILAAPKRYSVTLEPGRPAELLAIDGDPHQARPWSLVHLDLPGQASHEDLDLEPAGDPPSGEDLPTPAYLAALACRDARPERLLGFHLRP